MRFRLVFVCFCMLAILSGPTAAALASGGGSAGDQQYTDPFGNTKTTSSATQTASSQPATTTPAPSNSATAASTGTTPVATAATGATSTAAAGTGKTLPYTGLNLWTVSGLGLTLLVSGLLIRLRSRRA